MDNDKLIEALNNQNKYCCDLLKLMQSFAELKESIHQYCRTLETNRLDEEKKKLANRCWHLESEIFLNNSMQ